MDSMPSHQMSAKKTINWIVKIFAFGLLIRYRYNWKRYFRLFQWSNIDNLTIFLIFQIFLLLWLLFLLLLYCLRHWKKHNRNGKNQVLFVYFCRWIFTSFERINFSRTRASTVSLYELMILRGIYIVQHLECTWKILFFIMLNLKLFWCFILTSSVIGYAYFILLSPP